MNKKVNRGLAVIFAARESRYCPTYLSLLESLETVMGVPESENNPIIEGVKVIAVFYGGDKIFSNF